MEQLIIKRGDKHDVQLTIGNPPLDLAGGVAKVHVKPSVNGTAEVFDGTLNGNVVTWTLDGTLDPGKYILEVQITVGGNWIVTAPSDGMMDLIVLQDLA